MDINDVIPVSEARKFFSSLLRKLTPTVVGAHGKAEAVIMPIDYVRAYVPPPDVLDVLVTWAGLAMADFNLRPPVGQRDPEFLHPGDPFGKVVAWMWTSGQKEKLSMFVSEVMAELRVHNPRRDDQRLVTFEALLRGLPMALPWNFPDNQQHELINHLRATVPAYYGGDLNSTAV